MSTLVSAEILGSLHILKDLFAVIFIDLSLALDNAIIVGSISASLPRGHRKKAISIGLAFACLFRIGFGLFSLQLLKVVGLTFAGGMLLLWVAWKLWRQIGIENPNLAVKSEKSSKSFATSVMQILIADFSMSLDNSLAVAGTARHHWGVLVFGLILSVSLMGIASNYLSRLVAKYRWLPYVGVLFVFYVAIAMIYEGGADLLKVF